jgi:hypothetical protein
MVVDFLAIGGGMVAAMAIVASELMSESPKLCPLRLSDF